MFAIIAPLPFSYSLSYINIMYLKRTDFSFKIRIQEKNINIYFEKFDKNQIFLLALFHIPYPRHY